MAEQRNTNAEGLDESWQAADDLEADFRARLSAERFGRQFHYLHRTGSTNDVAAELARQGAPEGTVVVTDEQTSGRGRLGRAWLSPRGTALPFSVLLRSPLPAAAAFRSVMLASVSAVEAVYQVTGVQVALKWPNDLIWRDRKLAGVLSELSLTGEQVDYAVVGIGLNVNLEPGDLSGLAVPAVSLREITRTIVSRGALLAACMNSMEARYPLLLRPSVGEDLLWREWRSLLGTLGQQVTIKDGDDSRNGLAVDAMADGTLILQGDDGSRRPVRVGDVSLRRLAGT